MIGALTNLLKQIFSDINDPFDLFINVYHLFVRLTGDMLSVVFA